MSIGILACVQLWQSETRIPTLQVKKSFIRNWKRFLQGWN